MLEWTGERFLPWRVDPALAYEHLHRYFFAAQFAGGKVVLDLASGEGYGCDILAATANRVVGIDIDQSAVDHARQRYTRSNLSFVQGSITLIPIQESAAFDLIVCFEAIEHIEDHQGLLREIDRLLRPDGVLIVSTPNKTAYNEQIQHENTFHVKELEFDEFRSLLAQRFKHVGFLGQRIFAHSALWPVAPESGSDPQHYTMKRVDSEFELIQSEQRVPLYHVAVATNSPRHLDFTPSILVDVGNELFREKDRELAKAMEGIEWRDQQIKALKEGIEGLQEAAAWLEEQRTHLEERGLRLAQDIAWAQDVMTGLRSTIASHETALAWRAQQVDFLEKESAALQTDLRSTQQQLAQTTEQLEVIHASSGWQLILKMRRVRDRAFPKGSSRRRVLEAAIRFLRADASG